MTTPTLTTTLPTYTAVEFLAAFDPQALTEIADAISLDAGMPIDAVVPPTMIETNLADYTDKARRLAGLGELPASANGRYPGVVWQAVWRM